MASHTVHISSSGSFSPAHISLNIGDQVTYIGPSSKELRPGEVLILCVYPSSIFGDTRYIIPPEGSVTVEVLPKASGAFTTKASVGSTETECRPYDELGSDPDEPGGGEVGGDDVPDGEP